MSKATGKPRGRPKLSIDWNVFEFGCAVFCTKEEIAQGSNVSEDTLEREIKRKYGTNFAVIYKKAIRAGQGIP